MRIRVRHEERPSTSSGRAVQGCRAKSSRPLPIPQAEAPRDCPLCPRLVCVPPRVPRRASRVVERARFRRSATLKRGLRSSAWRPGKNGANRTGRPFTGDFAGELLYATLLKFGLAEGVYAADPADGLRLKGAVILNAVKCLPPANKPEPARNRDLPELSRGGAGRSSARQGAGRARPDRPCRRGASARPAALVHQVRPRRGARCSRRARPAVELPLFALQPEHPPPDAPMFESVFERATCYRSSTSRP